MQPPVTLHRQQSKEISTKLDKISDEQKKINDQLKTILSNIPNIAHKDVPLGNDENDNVDDDIECEGIHTYNLYYPSKAKGLYTATIIIIIKI